MIKYVQLTMPTLLLIFCGKLITIFVSCTCHDREQHTDSDAHVQSINKDDRYHYTCIAYIVAVKYKQWPEINS